MSAFFSRETLADLEPQPGRTAATVRITVAVLMVVVVMLAFRMPFLSIGPYLVFLLSQRDTLLTRAAGALGLFTAAVSFALFYGVAAVAWDVAWLRISLWALLFFAGYFLMRILSEPDIALGPLVVVALLAPFLDTAPDPNRVIGMTGWLWAVLGLAVASTLLVQWLFGQPLTRALLRNQMRSMLVALENLALAAGFGRETNSRLRRNLDPEETEDARERAEKLMAVGMLTNAQAASCAALIGGVEQLSKKVQSCIPEDAIALARGIRSTRKTVLRGAPFSSGPDCGPLSESWNQVAAGAFSGSLPPLRPPRFFHDDWLRNPEYREFAMRAAGATMACYLLMSLADWDGIHTAMITCAVTALPALDAREHKQRLRITGALLGGLSGIFAVVFLVPVADGLLALMTILAAGTAFAAWVSLGSARISYAGWQFALAFYMTVLHDPHPTMKMDAIRDRWVGILLGIVLMRAAFAGHRAAAPVESVAATSGAER